MTDKNEIIRRIEELLGSEGSHEQAANMLPALKAAGLVTFDASAGFEFAPQFYELPEREWLAMLAESDAA
jgi:hypothetical protein